MIYMFYSDSLLRDIIKSRSVSFSSLKSSISFTVILVTSGVYIDIFGANCLLGDRKRLSGGYLDNLLCDSNSTRSLGQPS